MCSQFPTHSHLAQLQSLTRTIAMASSLPSSQPDPFFPLIQLCQTFCGFPLLINTARCLHWHSKFFMTWLQLLSRYLLQVAVIPSLYIVPPFCLCSALSGMSSPAC